MAAAVLASLVAGAPSAAATPDPVGHDPTLIRQGDFYYAITSGVEGPDLYLPLRRTRDLVHWESAGAVFTAPPAWAVRAIGVVPRNLWAPDVTYVNGRYRVYYAASEFGLNDSVIGLATGATLDPRDPGYGWRDEGLVLQSRPGDDFNAIDPDVIADSEGGSWLAYGSYWSGIKLRRLDPLTGKLDPGHPGVVSLAARPGVGSLEAASIVRHGGFYYLFTSFDGCCMGVDSTYHVVMGRSTKVTGPYIDRAGVPMLAGGGTDVLHGEGRYAGPGHSDVYRGGALDLFVHHYYDRDDAGRPKLSVRRLDWVDGWPAVSAPLSDLYPAGYAPGPWSTTGPTGWRAYAMMGP